MYFQLVFYCSSNKNSSLGSASTFNRYHMGIRGAFWSLFIGQKVRCIYLHELADDHKWMEMLEFNRNLAR
jgi:hypothetical protein